MLYDDTRLKTLWACCGEPGALGMQGRLDALSRLSFSGGGGRGGKRQGEPRGWKLPGG